MGKTVRQRVKILLIDADPQEVRLLRKSFSSQKEYLVTLKCVGTLTEGLDVIRRGNVDMIFASLNLPDSQGLNTATRIHTQAADIPLVAILSVRSRAWLQALKRGAQDYFLKEEIDARLLARILRTNLEYKKVREELTRAGFELQAIFKAFPDLFFRLARDGTILAYGAGRASDLYVPPEKFLKRKMQDVLPAHVGRAFNKAVRRVLKTKSPDRFEYFLTVSGEKKKFEARLLPLLKEEIIAVVRDISEPEKLEQRLEKISECFLSFGPDPVENINRLVASCGRMLGASSALYNRLENNILCSLGQWNTPKDYVPKDRPQGHICYDIIKSRSEDLFVIRDLMHTAYAKTDPGVNRYKLQTYVGVAVKFAGKNIGSLCVLYQKDFIPQEIDKRTMGIIASAISVEEERYRKDQAIKISEKRLRRITDNTLELVTEVDLEGKIVYHSPSIKSILGYDAEAMVGTDLFPFIHPEDLGEFKTNFNKVIKEGKTASFFRARHADGRYLWIEATGSLVTDENGRPTGIVAGWRDVTERKQVEELLKDFSVRWQTTFDAVAEGVCVLGKDRRILQCNKAMSTMFHKKTKEMIGAYCCELIHGSSHPLPGCPIVRMSKTLQRETMELEINDHWFDLTVDPIKDAANNLIGIVHRVSDITERKRIEEALRISEAKFKALAEQSIAGTCLIQDGKFIYVNPRLAKILDFGQEEMVGLSVLDLVAEPDRDMVRENMRKRISGELRYAHYTFHALKKGGAQVSLEVHGSVLEYLGRPAIIATLLDITERKCAEEALQASEERYRKMVDAVTLYTYSVEVSGGRTVATHHSEECLAVTGYSPEDYARKIHLWHEMIYPDDRKLVENSIAQLLNGEEVSPVEHRIIRRDGEIIWIRNTHVPYRDEQGRIIRYDGLVENITGRKHAEQALRESETQLRQVIDLTPNFVFAKDAEGRFILVNKAVADTYGTTVEKLLGKKDSDFAKSAEEVRNFRRDDMEVIESGKSKLIPEEIITDAVGKVHILQTTKIPFRVSGTNAPAILGVSSDITELKEKEQNLRTLSHAIEQSPSIVIITDTKGNIEYVNPRFTQITGYGLDEVFWKNPRLLKSNETPTIVYKQMWETIISGDVWRGEIPNRKKNGEIFWAQVGISSIKNEKGSIVHFLAVEQDVTERKKAEEELDDYRKHLEELVEERTRELRHSERLAATGRLAASIAHEINNPLQGIMTHLEIVRDSLPEHFEKIRNYEFVKNNIEKIKDIVMKLLDTYRGTDEGKTRVDINEIIKGVESLVEHQLGLRNIRLKLNLSQNISSVEGWRQQLHQVFLNLVLNAQDSIKKDGQITIVTSFDESCITVQISDTGEGIRLQDMDHLFEPFFTTKPSSGTGLGLFVSHGIIKEHKGSIKVKSEVGKGSVFTVVLPI